MKLKNILKGIDDKNENDKIIKIKEQKKYFTIKINLFTI